MVEKAFKTQNATNNDQSDKGIGTGEKGWKRLANRFSSYPKVSFPSAVTNKNQ
jgi:hypothetical protein